MIKASSPIMTERHANNACDTLKKSGNVSDERAMMKPAPGSMRKLY